MARKMMAKFAIPKKTEVPNPLWLKIFPNLYTVFPSLDPFYIVNYHMRDFLDIQ